MPVDIDSPEGHIIRKMVPFSTMPNSIFKVICNKAVIETVKSGTFLFKRGDTAKELVYLLKGEVSLEVDKLKMEVIKAGSESSRFALAHQLPRKVNGVAKGTVQFMRLNSIYITTPDLSGTRKPTPPVITPITAKENPKESAQSRLSTLLMIPLLRSLPPAQLAKINEQLEEVTFLEGEEIIKQGDDGEFYYLIKSGDCLLSHKDNTPDQKQTVTKLKVWDSFGAEALIAGGVYDHTVTALNDISLLRINKKYFLSFIAEPLLKTVDEMQMQELMDKGGILVDVRGAYDYEKSHSAQAINVPLHELRNRSKTWNKENPVVLVSNNPPLTKAATFLLLSYKFSAYALNKNVEQEQPEMIIHTRKPVSHSSDDDVVVMDMLDDDFFNSDLVINNDIVIETRSIPKHQVATAEDTLAAENHKLRQKVKELQQRAEKAEQSRLEIMQKYQLLQKQTEKLKAMVESLAKYNGMA